MMDEDITITADRLREILNEALCRLEDYGNETRFRLSTSTYFLNEYSYVLQIGNKGFLALDGLEVYHEDECYGDEDK